MSALPAAGVATDSVGQDQASGLRALFGQALPSVYVVACPQRPGAVLPWVHALVRAAATRGRHVAWLDEIDLGRREGWPLAAAVKFDLSQALMAHVPLSSSLVAGGPGWWYASARRVHRLPALLGPSVDQRLAQSGVAFDAVLVSADTDLDASAGVAYAAHAHHLVVTEATPSALQRTCDWMVRRDAVRSAASWRVVVWGHAQAAQEAAQWLQSATSGLTVEAVSLLGHLELAPSTTGGVAALWAGRSAADLLDGAALHHMGLD